MPRLMREAAASGRPVAVTNYRSIEGYYVPEALMSQWISRIRELEEREALFPLLLGATRLGVAFPSQTLERLGVAFAFDWRRLNQFQALFNLGPTHDEEGVELPVLSPAQPIPVEEGDDIRK